MPAPRALPITLISSLFIIVLLALLTVVGVWLARLPPDPRGAAGMRCLLTEMDDNEKIVFHVLPRYARTQLLVGGFDCTSIRAALDLLEELPQVERERSWQRLQSAIKPGMLGNSAPDADLARERARLKVVLDQ